MRPFPLREPSVAAHVGATAVLPGELARWLAHVLGPAEARHAAARCAGTPELRDAILRALAQRFYPGVPVSTQAARMHASADTYAFARWPSDREHASLPARYRGTPDEYLWAAFKSGAPMPIGLRDLRRVLLGIGDHDG